MGSLPVLIAGYYGFHNAGDEAVLAAMLADIRALCPQATFTATSGDPAGTERLHHQSGLRAIARGDLRGFYRQLRSCAVFVSGGGSLLQDTTSLRNVLYQAALILLARRAHRPCMIYAQGVGPLRHRLSRRLAVAAVNAADLVTLRDEESCRLLRELGVRRELQVTADPVWGLTPAHPVTAPESHWVVSLRPWPQPNPRFDQALPAFTETVRTQAQASGCNLRFLAMQPHWDGPVAARLAQAGEQLTVPADPREILSLAGSGSLMLGMRLHALIFAAAHARPCVAIDYDPKVAALAKLLKVPQVSVCESPAVVRERLAQAVAPAAAVLDQLTAAARLNARLLLTLVKS